MIDLDARAVFVLDAASMSLRPDPCIAQFDEWKKMHLSLKLWIFK